MGSINFDINDALKHYMSDPAAIATPEADGALVDCETDPEALSNIALINPVLNPIVDAVAENPDSIMRSAYFDSLQFMLKYVLEELFWPLMPESLAGKVASTNQSSQPGTQHSFPHMRLARFSTSL